jgi:hypothetical protein
MGVYAYFLYKYLGNDYFNPNEMYSFFIQIAVFTLLIPLTLLYFFISIGFIDSIMIKDVSQRKIPLLIMLFVLIFFINKSEFLNLIPVVYNFFKAGIVAIFIAIILTYFKVKVSLHLISIASITCLVFFLGITFESNFIPYLSFFTLMIGCVASSRLYLKAHTIKELVYGFFIGLSTQIIVFLV